MPEIELPESPNSRIRRLAAQRRAAQAQAPNTGTTTNPDDWPIDPVLRGPAGEPGSIPATSNDASGEGSNSRRRRRSPSPDGYRDLTPLANQLLANPNKRLKTAGESDFLEFARARPDVRLMLVYHALIQQREVQQASATKDWTMPQELKENIAMITYSVLMSALVPTYRNLVIPTIVDLLKYHGQLPEGLALANMKKVRKTISSTATNYRSFIKKKLLLSIRKKWHVSKLATTLLASAPDLKVTSPLLMRLAFIRFQYVNAPNETARGKGFWPHVSDKLKELSSSTNDPLALTDILKDYLAGDEEVYTVGSAQKPKLTAPGDLTDMQKRIDRSAEAIIVTAAHEDDDEGEDDASLEDDEEN